MAKVVSDPFLDYAETLAEEEKILIKRFFSQFDSHCILSRSEKRKLRGDFERPANKSQVGISKKL